MQYIFLLIAAVSVFATVPQEGLVGEFLFNKGALDQSSNANDGVVYGATLTSDRFGNESSAYLFNGTTDYIEIPDHDAYSIATTGFLSISVWFRPDTLDFLKAESDNSYIHWMGKGANGKHEWVFRIYNLNSSRPNRISCYAYNLTGGLGAGSYVQEPETKGEWIHLVGTYDFAADQIRLYKNGVKKDQDPFSGYSIVPANGTAPLRIGTRDFSSFLVGAVDDLRVYNRVLSDAEILMLHQETSEPTVSISPIIRKPEASTKGKSYQANGVFHSGEQTPILK